MTDSHPTDETAKSTEAEESNEDVDGDQDFESDDRSESSKTGSLSRRGALAVLTALGLGSVATGEASADSGDHLGELWDGSPGTGRGLETVLREKGQALKGTAGTNTDDTNDIGVKGTTYSTRGIGLEGLAAASSGNTVGLKGRTDSPDGTALLGIVRNTNPGSSLAIEGLSRADDGTAIQGYADGSGNTVGVEGRVDSTDGYGLSTPDDAKVDGKMATVGDWQVTVDGDRAVQVGSESLKAGNVVHGHSANGVFDNAQASTVGGGGYFDFSTNDGNNVYDHFGTIAGGEGNIAGSADGDPTTATHATVGGGEDNTATSQQATVGGGWDNIASGEGATVGGGIGNTASGFVSTVAGGIGNTASGKWSIVPGGLNGKAVDDYSFVWNDGSAYHDTDGDGVGEGLSSSKDIAGSGVTGDETFHASARGGFRFITGSNSVTYIAGGSTGWATTSTRAAKTSIDPVEPEDVLAGVENMEVATWEYKDDNGGGEGVRHMGPMAEAFHSAFDLGASDTGINSINADGVAFAAIQGLSQQLEDKDDRIEELEDEVDGLEVENEELEAQNERLKERLNGLESRIADIEAGESSATAADD